MPAASVSTPVSVPLATSWPFCTANEVNVIIPEKLPPVGTVPTIGIVSILTFVGNFNAFDLIYTVKGALAGPDFATDLLGTFMLVNGEREGFRCDVR